MATQSYLYVGTRSDQDDDEKHDHNDDDVDRDENYDGGAYMQKAGDC